jgi:hypothetical protein
MHKRSIFYSRAKFSNLFLPLPGIILIVLKQF